MLTTVTSSKIACAISCLRTNGCMAVSVTKAADVMLCNIATDLSNENDVVDDAASEVLILGESSKSRETNLIEFFPL